MSPLKRVLYPLIGVLVLLGGALAVLLVSFDPNAYKPRLVAAVEARYHRTLHLDGDIRLRLFPKIGLQLAKVRLSERDGPAVFAQFDQVELYLSLLPLLRREAVVDEIRLDGLQADLVRHADGTTNFDDLRGADAPAPAPSAPAAAGRPIAFDVSGIRIAHSGVRWRDERGGDETRLEIVRFTTGRIADQLSTPIDLEVQARDSKLGSDLALGLQAALSLDLVHQRYGLSGLQAHLTGSAKGFSNIDLSVRGAAEFEPDLPRLKVRDFAIDAKARQGSLVLEGLHLKTPRIDADLGHQAITVEALVLDAEGQLGADRFKAHGEAPKLAIDGSSASGASIGVAAQLNGASRAIDARLDLSGVSGSAQAFDIAALALRVDARQGDASVKGSLNSALNGSLSAQRYRIPHLKGAFTVTAPSVPGKTAQLPIDLDATLDLKQSSASLDLVTAFQDSHLKAHVAASPLKSPHYRFDLDADRLDLDRYLPPPAPEAPQSPVAAPTKAAAVDPPIDLSALRTLSLDGHVTIGSLTARHLQLSKLNLTIQAAAGRVAIEPLSAALYQGTLSGSAAVDAQGNRITLRQTLTGVAIGPLLKDLMQKAPLDGHGTVMVDVSTAGATVGAMKRALNGKASLALKDGAINGINLAESFRKAKATLTGGATDQAAEAGQKTDFSELGASFQLHNGVAHNEDLSARSPFLRLSGHGDIDLGASTLDYLAQATLVASTAGQGGQDLGGLKGIPVPVRVSGPFAAPRFRLDFSDLLKGAAAAKVQEQIDQKKQQLKGQLQDAIQQKLQGGGAPGTPGKKPDAADVLKGLFK